MDNLSTPNGRFVVRPTKLGRRFSRVKQCENLDDRQQRKNAVILLSEVIVWLLLCQNLYSKLANFGLTNSKIISIQDDDSAPAISLCQQVLDAFADCHLFSEKFHCPFDDAEACTRWLFAQHPSVGEIFHKLDNCSFHRQRLQVHAIQPNAHPNNLQSPLSRWWPVTSYLLDKMYCLYFTGYSQPDALYSVSVKQRETLSWTTKQELLIATLQSIKSNAFRQLYHIQTRIIQNDAGSNWTFAVNQFRMVGE